MLLRQKNRAGNFMYIPALRVYNTHRGLLDEIVRRTGAGSVVAATGKRNAFKAKTPKVLYAWKAGSLATRQTIEHILPWLIVKARQAEVVLEAYKVKDKMSNGLFKSKGMKRDDNARRYAEIRAELHVLADKIAKLNGKEHCYKGVKKDEASKA